MRLSVPQALLSEHLQIVSRAVPTKSTISAVEGLLFESDGNKITMTATNLELGIRSSFETSSLEKGRVILPSKFIDIVRRMPGESIQIVMNQENYLTEIKSGQSEFQLYGLKADDFPAFPSGERDHASVCFEVNSSELRRALRQTLFAVSHDEGKPAFTGVFFSCKDSKLSLSASDTFRLATTTCPVQNQAGNGDFLVPGRILQEIVRVFTEDDLSIHATLLQNQLLFETEKTNISCRLLNENYPNIERVIPTSFSGKATIGVNSFQQTVERAFLLSEGVNHVIRLEIEKEFMTVKASSKYGKIQEKIPVDFAGEDQEISLNARFLLDVLKTCEGDACILHLTGQNKPCIIKDVAYERYIYLVLPIKI